MTTTADLADIMTIDRARVGAALVTLTEAVDQWGTLTPRTRAVLARSASDLLASVRDVGDDAEH